MHDKILHIHMDSSGSDKPNWFSMQDISIHIKGVKVIDIHDIHCCSTNFFSNDIISYFFESSSTLYRYIYNIKNDGRHANNFYDIIAYKTIDGNKLKISLRKILNNEYPSIVKQIRFAHNMERILLSGFFDEDFELV